MSYKIFCTVRSLSEAVAANVLVIAVYLLAPGYEVRSFWRLASSGFLLGLSAVLRVQLLPAIALAYLWSSKDSLPRRLPPLTIGGLTALALFGWFDAMTWHYPFESLWNYFDINYIKNLSAFFGTRPWWTYPYWLCGYWGGTIAILLPLTIIGGRKSPLLLLIALVIFVSHSVIGHKEYRFVYPAILFLSISAGFGLVDFIGILRRGLNAERTDGRVSPKTSYVATTFCWLLLTGVNIFGDTYSSAWNRDHDHVLASLYVSKNMKSACGVGLYGITAYGSGGYSFLHLRVPIYAVIKKEEAPIIAKETRAFNVMISDEGGIPRKSATAKELGYQEVKCFGKACVNTRVGSCQPTPMHSPGLLPVGLPVPAPYPQTTGILSGVTQLSRSSYGHR